MKFTYKEREDLIWSLKMNIERLKDYEGARADEARESAARLRKLVRRLETTR